jgi:long-chain acyl-CoA synthetase
MVGTNAAVAPDFIGVASDSREITWAELEAMAGRWAAALRGHGLRPGDRVASLLPNRIDLLVHYLGCIAAGLVAVPLNYRYVPPQVDHALETCGASALVAHAERAVELAGSRRVPELERGVVWFLDDPAHVGPHALSDVTTAPAGQPTTLDLLARAPAEGPRWHGDLDDPAFVLFTSGSTGPAKGVTHSLRSMGWMTAMASAAFGLTDEDVFLPASSMSHLGSLLWSLASLSVGARVVVAHTFDGDELLPLIRRHRPTVMAMIPAALTALVRDHRASAADFASLRICRSGSDHVPAELDTEFEALAGFLIDEGYGMSEIGLATLNPPAGTIKPGSIGVPIPGMAITLRDATGAPTPPGEVGRIHMRAPSATVGYWEAPDATTEVFDDEGWLDSGDLAHADEEGYLWFFGRVKQVIVHDGSNISPTEVEDALSEHPAVTAVGVVGVGDTVHGQNVRAYVVLDDDQDRPTSQELIRFARARVGYRAPEEVVVLDELPLNPTGKVDRVGLAALAEEQVNARGGA